ncbi:MAG TPA: 3'-5' exonuclease, partial [Myxococcota bacterium]|nr:3'-5' exonuclease [Myxococcota bacterium]
AGPIRDFLALVDELGAQVRGVTPAEAIARVLQKSGYLAALEREATPEAQARLENLRELVSSAEDFVAESVEGDEERTPVELFLDQVALVSDVDSWDRRAERVSLMTLHSAKGLEFPVVFLVGLEEGILPHASAARDAAGIEEERRLFYVGMTRAMERLSLSCAQERRRYGSRTFAVPSRFLREIPEEVLQGELPEARAAGPLGGRRDDGGLDYSYGQDEDEAAGAAIPRGMRVRHPVFGAGTVLDVSGAGPGQKLRVRFDRVGVKTLVLRFANLEPA